MNWHNVAILWAFLSGWFSFMALSYCGMVEPKRILYVVGVILGVICLVLTTLLVGGVI